MHITLDEPRKEERRVPLQSGWGVPLSTLPRHRWEYLIVRATQGEDGPLVSAVDGDADGALGAEPTPIWQALQTLGVKEWELAAVQNAGEGWVYIFKRALPAGESA